MEARQKTRERRQLWDNPAYSSVLQDIIVSRLRGISAFYLGALSVYFIYQYLIRREPNIIIPPVFHIVPAVFALFWVIYGLQRTSGNFSAFVDYFFRFQRASLLFALAILPSMLPAGVELSCAHPLFALMLGVFFPLRICEIVALFSASQLLFSLCAILCGRAEFTPAVHLYTTLGVLLAGIASAIYTRYCECRLVRDIDQKILKSPTMPLFLLCSVPSCVFSRENGSLLLYNPSFMSHYEFTQQDVPEIRWGFLDNAEEWEKLVQQCEQNEDYNYEPVLQTLPGGRKRWNLMHLRRIDYLGTPAMLCTAFGLPEIRELERTITENALTDALTGVYNRRKGLEFLAEEIDRVKTKGGNFVLCVAEIENIKKINDDYGREKGNECIQTVCQHLLRYIPGDGIVFRSCGDAFAIILKNTSLEVADTYAYKVTDCLYELNRRNDNPCQICVTFGSMECDQTECRTPKQLISSPQLRKFLIRTPKCPLDTDNQYVYELVVVSNSP